MMSQVRLTLKLGLLVWSVLGPYIHLAVILSKALELSWKAFIILSSGYTAIISS